MCFTLCEAKSRSNASVPSLMLKGPTGAKMAISPWIWNGILMEKTLLLRHFPLYARRAQVDHHTLLPVLVALCNFAPLSASNRRGKRGIEPERVDGRTGYKRSRNTAERREPGCNQPLGNGVSWKVKRPAELHTDGFVQSGWCPGGPNTCATADLMFFAWRTPTMVSLMS